jgi:hypothetical protein
MSRSRALLILVVVVAATLGLWYGPRLYRGAHAGPLPDLLSLSPSDSTVIFYADLASLRSSPLVQKLEALAPAPTVDRDYAEFVAATGFDFERDLDRLVLAVRPGNARQTLVFAEGRFDRQKIGQYALRTGKIEKHNGRDVYMMPSTTSGKNIYLTFLEGNRLALSDGGDLSTVLAVVAGGTPAPFDAALQERLARVAGAPVFAVAKAPDPAAVDAGVGAGGGGGGGTAALASATPFQLLRWVSLAAKPDGSQIVLSAEGECDTPEQAQKVAAAVEFLRTLLRSGLSDPKARGQMSNDTAASVGRLLKAASITSDATRARLLLAVTPDMLGAPASSAPLAGK